MPHDLFYNIYKPSAFEHDVDVSSGTHNELSALFDWRREMLFPLIQSNQRRLDALIFRTVDNIISGVEVISDSPQLLLHTGIPLDRLELTMEQSMPRDRRKYIGQLGAVVLEMMGPPEPPYEDAKLPYLMEAHHMTYGPTCVLLGALDWHWPFTWGPIQIVDRDCEVPWKDINSFEVVPPGSDFKCEPLIKNTIYWFSASGCRPVYDAAEIKNYVVKSFDHELFLRLIQQELQLLRNRGITGESLRDTIGNKFVKFEWPLLPNFKGAVMHRINTLYHDGPP